MSLMMWLLARAYAPLGARGALVEGLPLRKPVRAGEAEPRSAAPYSPSQAQARRPVRVRAEPARHDGNSLGAWCSAD